MEKKKFKKLTINKMNGFPMIGEQEQMSLVGGTSLFGHVEYYNRYGKNLPSGTGYDPINDVCYDINNPGVAEEYPYGTTTISGCPACQAYGGHWRSGANGADESAQRVDTPLFEYLWKSVTGGHSHDCPYY